jgi:glycosyltransferase involved in cell wall biosynthesis
VSATTPGIVFLSHAVDRSGPPIYLLHLLRWLRAHTDVPTRVVALEGGPLADEVRRLTRLDIVGEPHRARGHRGRLRRRADPWRQRPDERPDPDALIYVNTAWSVRGLHYLPGHRGPVVAHVHELEVGLDYHLPPPDRDVLFRADHWIAASQAVARNLADRWSLRAEVRVHHEMIDTSAPTAVPDDEVRALRSSIGAGAASFVVGTTAVVNWRKAPDLFVELAATIVRSQPDLDVRFAWVGVDESDPLTAAVRRDARRAGIAERFHLVPVSDRPEAWMRAFDLFVLPAREDAYPLAALEAAAAARPIVCFEAGGMPEFVRDGAGAVVDFPDVDAMAAAVTSFGIDPNHRTAVGRAARDLVVGRHDIAVAAPRLWADLEAWVPAR